jgi:hypothetical protein
LQIDTVAVTAGCASRKLKSTVHLAGTGRLVEIEICGLDGNLDRDLMIVGLDGTRENGRICGECCRRIASHPGDSFSLMREWTESNNC